MYKRILVPIDGSPTSDRGLEEAILLARLTRGKLRLFHAVDETSLALGMEAYSGYGGDWLGVLRNNGARLLARSAETVRDADIEVDTVLDDSFSGVVHERVTNNATNWPADLIVLGTHGRRGIRRMVLGSSAEKILRYSPVPVLLVRGSDGAIDEALAHTSAVPVELEHHAGSQLVASP